MREFLGTLTGDSAIMAHSLGNVVVKVALTHGPADGNPGRIVPKPRPATVKHYFAVNAAVPLEATDAAQITAVSKTRMRHPDWKEFDGEERLWPTHWHELFPDSDARSRLTWQSIFSGGRTGEEHPLSVGTNFYSSGEDVLANPQDSSIPAWQPLFFRGRRAWVCQEKLKGGAAQGLHPAQGIAVQFFRSSTGEWTGGWNTNKAWYVPDSNGRRRFASECQDDPAEVPSDALPQKPFFALFQASEGPNFYLGYAGSRLHAPIGDPDAHDEARKLVTIAKCLGEAIPALSYAQGANFAERFRNLGQNVDMNHPDMKNGWPARRGDDANWKHGDFVAVGYTFIYRVYDKMAQELK